ncbi:protein downstream neighbor of Son [Cinnamomum micranthum f. kanehirae]|uniref:Protein downstream neighbor of Son n=1 Tax=Cinnamomum micranthum f. kanehirae TaxID=337451 RepID=A0A3S3MB72_9MAGN|nr:protein downstream neighbor of Son [Cinnamomum micranthum f. kanehirae]
MAKVAVPDPLTSNYFPLGKGPKNVQVDATMKRKTPSELRGEQLKRRNCRKPDELSGPSMASDGTTVGYVHGLKMSKTPKYINTRVDKVFPVKKSSDMFRILSGKEKAKGTIPSYEQSDKPNNPSVACNMSANNKPQQSCERSEAPDSSNCSVATANDEPDQTSQKIENCSQNTFRSVAELSLGSEALSGPGIINMDKALKGLGARELPSISGLPTDSHGIFHDPSSISSGNFCSEVHIPGYRTPIDFTLKTTMRLVLSSSVSWCHRLNSSGAFIAASQFGSQFGLAWDQHICKSQGHTPAEVLFSNALQSWAYPQSSLPPSVISAMTLAAVRGETDFLLKRQLAWEDSFRSLYYLLRKNMCDIFYFCTSQFVVMFIGGDFSGKSQRSCNAYLSQSTRGLRSLLTEHDICFSMPLFHSEVEQATAEDLVELSEIEKCNLGQARRLDSMTDVDNSSKSLLAFIGSEAVHGLYDFLINYRSFFSSLTGTDVPILYSPVPFQNASLCVPEVRCKEVKRANAVGGFSMDDGAFQDSSSVCYSIEIKDAILPPWTTYGVCTAMGSGGKSFEASFSSNPISDGLNAALDAVSQKPDSHVDSKNGLPESDNAFRIVGAAVAPCLRSASLRSLKYSNGSYVASLSPL